MMARMAHQGQQVRQELPEILGSPAPPGPLARLDWMARTASMESLVHLGWPALRAHRERLGLWELPDLLVRKVMMETLAILALLAILELLAPPALLVL